MTMSSSGRVLRHDMSWASWYVYFFLLFNIILMFFFSMVRLQYGHHHHHHHQHENHDKDKKAIITSSHDNKKTGLRCRCVLSPGMLFLCYSYYIALVGEGHHGSTWHVWVQLLFVRNMRVCEWESAFSKCKKQIINNITLISDSDSFTSFKLLSYVQTWI